MPLARPRPGAGFRFADIGQQGGQVRFFGVVAVVGYGGQFAGGGGNGRQGAAGEGHGGGQPVWAAIEGDFDRVAGAVGLQGVGEGGEICGGQPVDGHDHIVALQAGGGGAHALDDAVQASALADRHAQPGGGFGVEFADDDAQHGAAGEAQVFAGGEDGGQVFQALLPALLYLGGDAGPGVALAEGAVGEVEEGAFPGRVQADVDLGGGGHVAALPAKSDLLVFGQAGELAAGVVAIVPGEEEVTPRPGGGGGHVGQPFAQEGAVGEGAIELGGRGGKGLAVGEILTHGTLLGKNW